MSYDQQSAAVTTLAALGMAAFAVGRRVGRTEREERAEFVPATVHDDENH